MVQRISGSSVLHIKKVNKLVALFSLLTAGRSQAGEMAFTKESDFVQTIEDLFDIFCVDDQQRKVLEKQHGLRMADTA